MKKLVKILPILLTAMMVFMAVSPVLATEFKPTQVKPEVVGDNVAGIKKAGDKIVGIIQVVGTIAAVGILMVVGIKYMMGSAEQKAEYKKVMIPYIIGAVLLFAASTVAGLIYDAKDLFDTTTATTGT